MGHWDVLHNPLTRVSGGPLKLRLSGGHLQDEMALCQDFSRVALQSAWPYSPRVTVPFIESPLAVPLKT
jgi:hypothetical protein